MLTNLYQIYYSDDSRHAPDPGFIPFDDTGQRPDWREDWPVRRYLPGNALDEKLLFAQVQVQNEPDGQ